MREDVFCNMSITRLDLNTNDDTFKSRLRTTRLSTLMFKLYIVNIMSIWCCASHDGALLRGHNVLARRARDKVATSVVLGVGKGKESLENVQETQRNLHQMAPLKTRKAIDSSTAVCWQHSSSLTAPLMHVT